MKTTNKFLIAAASVALAASAQAQFTGPSTASTPYLQSSNSNYSVTSILTVDNTGANADDTVNKIGGGTYQMNGIPDGLGAYDNGNGTFTVLMNHELGSTAGVVRDHGAKGAYVSEFIINKSDFSVVAGGDLIKNVYGWNSTTQTSNTTATPFAFNRFCSADLAKPSAFSFTDTNNVTYGTSERLFLNGEEGGATGYVQATVATGSNKGGSYTLGKFNYATNGSGVNAVGAWENVVANPFSQLKTVVVGTNDGGTGVMTNSVSVYVGMKTNTGTEADRAGLTNGVLKNIVVTGNAAEITNATTRTTAITSGTAFTLSSTSATVFSRPEDAAWNPLNTSQLYFVTTDRLDQVSDGVGSQIGNTRLWRLNFADITNPDLGGTIDLLLDGASVGGVKTNMFDNLTVNEKTGKILLQEDVGGAAHNGKVWEFDPSVGLSSLTQVLLHDPARFGNIGVAATSPFSNDEEASGIIDITDILTTGVGARPITAGNAEAWYLTSDQAHYITGITTPQVEGGQLLAVHAVPEASTTAVYALVATSLAGYALNKRRRKSQANA